MRKSTLFISAALTAFMLAVLFGVVSAYKDIVNTSQQAVEQAPSPEVAQVVAAPPIVPTQIPLPTEIPNITPEQAASIASAVLGRTDLYSVEVTQLEAADVYLVTFSSGDLVYVSLTGQVVSISKLPVTVIAQPSSGGGHKSGGGGGGGEHEDGGGDDD